MTYELPGGWATTPLKSIAEINPRHSKDSDDAAAVTFIPMAAISEDSPEFLFREERLLGEVRKGFMHFAEGDVLFAKITPCMENGKGAVARDLSNGLGCGTTEVHVIRPLEGIAPLYIYRFLSQWNVRRLAKGNFAGTAGQLRVPTDFIKELSLPLAPLAEQRRIVASLDAVFAKAHTCQERLAQIYTFIRRFRQSVLAAACSGRLTADWRRKNPEIPDASELVAELELAHDSVGGHKRGNAAPPTEEAHDLSLEELPENWCLTDLRTAVCTDRPITYGILKPGPDTSNGIPYVRVADYPNDRLNLESIRRTSKDIERSYARARLREGDILLSIRGTVGRVVIVPPELGNANITQDTARISIQPALSSDFVMWYLRSAPTQKRMQRAVKGVAVRGINIGDVRALQVPVPPRGEQVEIVRRIEELLGLADRIEARYKAVKRQVDRLPQSMLAKAFRGELVPTEAELAEREGRTYESAEQLLERIRATKPEVNSKSKTARNLQKRRAG